MRDRETQIQRLSPGRMSPDASLSRRPRGKTARRSSAGWWRRRRATAEGPPRYLGSPSHPRLPECYDEPLRQSRREDAAGAGAADAGAAGRRAALGAPGGQSAGAAADAGHATTAGSRPGASTTVSCERSQSFLERSPRRRSKRRSSPWRRRRGSPPAAYGEERCRDFQGAALVAMAPARRVGRRSRGRRTALDQAAASLADGQRRPLEKAELESARAALLRDLGRPEEAERAGRRALRLAHRAGGPRERARPSTSAGRHRSGSDLAARPAAVDARPSGRGRHEAAAPLPAAARTPPR